jgi:hypothetical protein
VTPPLGLALVVKRVVLLRLRLGFSLRVADAVCTKHLLGIADRSHRCGSVSQKLVGSLARPIKGEQARAGQLAPGSRKGQSSSENAHRRSSNEMSEGRRGTNQADGLPGVSIETIASFAGSALSGAS